MTLYNGTYGFQVDYPEDWEIDVSSFASFFTSEYEDFDDLILENISVATDDLSYYGYSDMGLDEYTDLSLDGLLTDPDYVLVDRGERDLGSYEGRYLLGGYEFGGMELEVLQIFTLSDGVVYLFTYTYESAKADLWEDTVDHMIDSFEITSFVDPASGLPTLDGVNEELASDMPDTGVARTSLIHVLQRL